jgi:hypothetical protein
MYAGSGKQKRRKSLWQMAMQAAIAERLEADMRVEALFLGGSLGRGAGDRFSDVDLVAVVPSEHQEAVAADWKAVLGAIAPVVFWNEFPRAAFISNAVTEEWQRVDLMIIDRPGLLARSRNSLKPLFDRPGLYTTLAETRPWHGPSKARVEGLIKEFIRIFGLLPVTIGRGEFLLGQAGVGLLRGMLADLLREEVERADKGGMLNWTKLYSPEQLALIASVPAPQPTRECIIEANLACAYAFLPRARRMAEHLGITWPQNFEDAAWRHIERELGVARPADIS